MLANSGPASAIPSSGLSSRYYREADSLQSHPECDCSKRPRDLAQGCAGSPDANTEQFDAGIEFKAEWETKGIELRIQYYAEHLMDR